MTVTENRSASARTIAPRLADRLHHDDLVPDDVREVRAEVRAFAEEHVLPLAREIGSRDEDPAAFPFELFREMGRAGLLAVPFSEADGGRGLAHPAAATAVAIEELAHVSSSIAAVYDVHCILAGHALTHGSPQLREAYLRPLVAGERIAAFATTEPEASTDLSPSAVQTVARHDGDDWVVNGHKRFITNAPVADFVAVLCRTGEAELTEIVVDLDAPGVQVGRPDRKLGNRGQLTADIVFDDVRVPVANTIGVPGRGLAIALASLTRGRIGIAAAGVGLAQSAFDEAVARLLDRRAFGRRIAQFQHWQFTMADRATELENARNLYLKAALRLDRGAAVPEPEAAMAKLYATRLATDLARDAVQAFGGYGFLRELAADGWSSKVEELYRDAKVGEIYEGTNEIQRWIIARQIFGRDATG
ncbi:acyl-CoA dehydrogenase family protein [Pseudonocardia thermophila]|uniref:acyl-CoA dehydrogenase family protein n=1 Tax=Pseudonocardia thermophila TaxID=1848 RepID=UPI00248E552E|nr:acyl-CoA dehydrogenase family protein [Pseudonocardia thermophila]